MLPDVGFVRPTFMALQPDLNSDKNFSTIHPEKNQPEDDQSRATAEKCLVAVAKGLEDILTEVDPEGIYDEFVDQMDQNIDGNRIHSDDDKRERPLAPSFHVDDVVEKRQ